MSDFIQWTYDNRLQISIDLAAGSVSGIANCISSHPLDTVKVRMQMSNDGVLSTLKKIFKNEGTKGFYKGMSFPILSIPITNAIVFSVYEFWRSFFIGNSNKQLTYFQTAFCGSIAGSSAAFFSCPIELTKCKLQMQSTEKIYKNPMDCIQQIYQKEGFKSLFRGMCATQQREILGYSAQFAVYELIKDFLCDLSQKAEPSTTNLLISGGLAGVSCWTIGYPQDTIKTILQCQKPTDQGIYKVRFYDGGFLDCLRKKVISEGLGSIWKGYSVCILRSFYANAIGFYAYSKNIILVFEILNSKIYYLNSCLQKLLKIEKSLFSQLINLIVRISKRKYYFVLLIILKICEQFIVYIILNSKESYEFSLQTSCPSLCHQVFLWIYSISQV